MTDYTALTAQSDFSHADLVALLSATAESDLAVISGLRNAYCSNNAATPFTIAA